MVSGFSVEGHVYDGWLVGPDFEQVFLALFSVGLAGMGPSAFRHISLKNANLTVCNAVEMANDTAKCQIRGR